MRFGFLALLVVSLSGIANATGQTPVTFDAVESSDCSALNDPSRILSHLEFTGANYDQYAETQIEDGDLASFRYSGIVVSPLITVHGNLSLTFKNRNDMNDLADSGGYIQIPAVMTLHSVGLKVLPISSMGFDINNFKGFKGRSLSEVFGTYKGVQVTAQFAAGGLVAKTKNENGVDLTLLRGGFGAGAELSETTVTIVPANTNLLPVNCRVTDQIL